MAIPIGILQRDDVFHTIPPMTFQQVMGRLDAIERRLPTALNGLHGDVHELNWFAANHTRIWGQEWGAAKEPAIVNPDCILISGGAAGVAWEPFLNAGLIPLAHSHPFHRNPLGLGRALANGGVLWNEINGVNPVQNLKKRLKVFPTAGDIAFCAAQGLATHTVKTPYCVVHPQDEPDIVWIVNPDANPNFANAPRLHFRIFDVREIDRGHYKICLVAMRNNQDFWRKHDINVVGGGAAGLNF